MHKSRCQNSCALTWVCTLTSWMCPLSIEVIRHWQLDCINTSAIFLFYASGYGEQSTFAFVNILFNFLSFLCFFLLVITICFAHDKRIAVSWIFPLSSFDSVILFVTLIYLSLTEAAGIVFEICKAIEYLHSRDIAHRDVKVWYSWFILANLCNLYLKITILIWEMQMAKNPVLETLGYQNQCFEKIWKHFSPLAFSLATLSNLLKWLHLSVNIVLNAWQYVIDSLSRRLWNGHWFGNLLETAELCTTH